MTRPDQASELLLRILRAPDSMPGLALTDWDRVLPLARRAKLLAHLGFHAERAGVLDRLPQQLVTHTAAARIAALHRQQMTLWELDRVMHALRGTDVPVVVLKGCAYLVARLPFSAGRTFADLDIMTVRPALDFAEAHLHARGWQGAQLDAYDQRYYREWTHELPPMRHPARLIELDLHHTIAPPTSRARPDPLLLFDDAQPIDGQSYRVLSPPDMVLHSAVHLFQDSDLDSRLRDLVDLHELLCHFGVQPQFWAALAARADRLGLGRSLFYAAHYTRRFLGTAMPPEFLSAIACFAPQALTLSLMDRLVTRALPPQHPDEMRRGAAQARWLLYVRSHWLKMPPLMLTRHLFHKAFISKRAASDSVGGQA